MTQYMLIKTEGGGYGIIALQKQNGDAEIIDEVSNVSDNMTLVQSIVDDCNKHSVDPIHLRDVIEDKLYAVYY